MVSDSVFTCVSNCPWWLWIVGVGVSIKLYVKLTTGIYYGKERLDGKTVIVTGSNAGIGKYCAIDFARRGARVIMVCRDMIKAERVRSEIVEETKNRNVILKHVDFSSLRSVRSCANEILKEEKRIDVLLNNAGAGGLGIKQSADGLDLLTQTNYFGPFLFTNILLGKLKSSAPSRIVNVSSTAHKIANLELDHLKKTRTSFDVVLYANTKLANIYFTNELSKKLEGTGVTVNSLHPGVFASEIIRNAGWLFKFVWRMIIMSLFKVKIDQHSQPLPYGKVTFFYHEKNSTLWGELKFIDFSSFETVRKCAEEIVAEVPRIDILLNNAGAVGIGFEKTIDGLDVLMQTNYFGPFLFTNMLLDTIKKSAPSRIVNVTSTVYKYTNLDPDTAENPRAKSVFELYAKSKLANIYFSNELARRLDGTGVTSNSLHPGVFFSEISRFVNPVANFLYNIASLLLLKSTEDGAQTSIFLCVSGDVENISGEYYEECKMSKLSNVAKYNDVARKLWDASENAVNLQRHERHY